MAVKNANTEGIFVDSTMRRLEANLGMAFRLDERAMRIIIINKIWTGTYSAIQNTLRGVLWELTMELEDQSEQ